MQKIVVRRSFEGDLSGLSTLPPLLQRIYAARSIRSHDEVNHELSQLLPYKSLLNIEKAVERLSYALHQQQQILIIGDFDADGATSTALAVSALKVMGAKHVNYIVPNRFKYGYGLTPEIVDVASQSKPDLIITVDNGIASFAGVQRANELNIDVLITDHHLPGEELPAACAIVNPCLPNDLFPSKSLAGVGVIFYVMCALRSHLKEQNWFEKNNIPNPNMAQFLDFVALGTVADVVSLDKNNRILVQQGLKRIRAGQAHIGIFALLQVAGRDRSRIVATDLGFAIGPRLNAAGRLDDMSLGIACLLEDDMNQALAKAQQLDQLNHERRHIEAQMQREAFDIVNRLDFKRQLPLGICLYDPNWHQGVIGLVASRVKEKLNRPVIAFAKVDDETIKGSARSITGLHIRDILDSIATEHPHLLSKFGGHAMAAGLTLHIDALKPFSEIFAAEISKHLSEQNRHGQIETDGELSFEDFSLKTAELIRNSGPWGQGFPEPVFDGVFQIADQRLVGERHLKLTLKNPDSNQHYEGIAFNINTSLWPNPRCREVHVVYRLDVNDYNGRQKLQLLVEDLTEKV